MHISLAITTHNEGSYVEELLSNLVGFVKGVPHGAHSYEIVIVDDNSNHLDTLRVLTQYSLAHDDILKVYNHSLNGDFATHKNFLNSKCTGDWIFQLDADETVSHDLLSWLPLIIDSNQNIDAYWVPRINTVDGLTLAHVQKWGWVLTSFPEFITVKSLTHDDPEYQLLKQYNLILDEENGYVRFQTPVVMWPDMQMRLYRRTEAIKWTRKVHEQLTGYDNFSHFPLDLDYAIRHHKEIERQEKQNAFYETL